MEAADMKPGLRVKIMRKVEFDGCWVDEMDEMIGKVVTISSTDESDWFYIKEDASYCWPPECAEPYEAVDWHEETPRKWLEFQDKTELLGRKVQGNVRAVFEEFFHGEYAGQGLYRKCFATIPDLTFDELREGVALAARLAYAQGAMYSMRHGADQSRPDFDPYEQFSAAWEGWSDGYNDAACSIFLGDAEECKDA